MRKVNDARNVILSEGVEKKTSNKKLVKLQNIILHLQFFFIQYGYYNSIWCQILGR